MKKLFYLLLIVWTFGISSFNTIPVSANEEDIAKFSIEGIEQVQFEIDMRQKQITIWKGSLEGRIDPQIYPLKAERIEPFTLEYFDLGGGMKTTPHPAEIKITLGNRLDTGKAGIFTGLEFFPVLGKDGSFGDGFVVTPNLYAIYEELDSPVNVHYYSSSNFNPELLLDDQLETQASDPSSSVSLESKTDRVLTKSPQWQKSVAAFIRQWSREMGQSYTCYYPESSQVFRHAGQDLETLLETLTVEGLPVDISLESDHQATDYLVHAIYSTYRADHLDVRLITYFIVEHKGSIQVLVSEQTDGSHPIDFHETANLDLREGIQRIDGQFNTGGRVNSQSDVTNDIAASGQGGGSGTSEVDTVQTQSTISDYTQAINETGYDLSTLFANRDRKFTAEEATKFFELDWSDPCLKDGPMELGVRYSHPEHNPEPSPTVCVLERYTMGEYAISMSQGGGPSATSVVFKSMNKLVRVSWHRGPKGTAYIINSETYQEEASFDFDYPEWQSYQDLH